MEVHFSPETEKKLADLAAENGRATADELAQSVIEGYFDELAQTRMVEYRTPAQNPRPRNPFLPQEKRQPDRRSSHPDGRDPFMKSSAPPPNETRSHTSKIFLTPILPIVYHQNPRPGALNSWTHGV